ncbi:putative chloroquine-resistance transporter [Rosa chinensis]|uniref:Putative chloroquine-resistance transporter n=1 Tax=Rosa chinensis TaxID=74649 RepID=A0A2P6PGL3_ROSCH|nr:putative chloroquine-resistance transporter [Rosa chinensis]
MDIVSLLAHFISKIIDLDLLVLNRNLSLLMLLSTLRYGLVYCGKSLDILVVNSFGSAYQALFVLLFLPFLSNMRGIPFAQLPTYLKDGAGCFLNIGAGASGKLLYLFSFSFCCNGAPLLPLLYVAANLLFNISLMNVVKISSAVVSSLVVMLSVPISIYVLSLPLPYLQEGATLSPFFLFGSAILVLGLILYSIPQPAKDVAKIN